MFGKRMNTIFWLLIIPSIFFLFANTNFVNPIVKKVTDGEYYEAFLLNVSNFSIGKGTYNESLNWLILISLGTLFSLVSFFVFAKYFLLSNKFKNSKFRNYFPSIKKQIALGNSDYELINKTDKSLERDSKIIFTFFILMFLSVFISLVINLSIPFILESSRIIAPANVIKEQGDDLIKVNEVLAKYNNNGILLANLSGVIICSITAISLIITAIFREIKNSKNIQK